MLYCFVQEDLQAVANYDPLILQSTYAKAINRYCCCSIKHRNVTDSSGAILLPRNEQVFLRATCPLTAAAQNILMEQGFSLVEKPTDIQKILHWDSLQLSDRTVIACKCEQLVTGQLSPDALFENPPSKVFLKTRSKGLHAVISWETLQNPNDRFLSFLKQKCEPVSSDLLLSPFLCLKKDSLGNKEARFFVLNGKILNASRNMKALKHSVPHSFIQKAREIVSAIAEKRSFPQNYVLDLGEFENNSRRWIDIIELNPITSSLCYCNNSIFSIMLPEIQGAFSFLRFGYEFCLDYLSHPSHYTIDRVWGNSYEFYDEETYYF